MTRLAALIVIAGAALPALAQAAADPSGPRWKVADNCVTQATKQVPDRTPEALKKRDGLVSTCMQQHGYPPLKGIAPSDKPADPAAAPKN